MWVIENWFPQGENTALKVTALKVAFYCLCFSNVIKSFYKHPSQSLQPSPRDCKSTAFLL